MPAARRLDLKNAQWLAAPILATIVGASSASAQTVIVRSATPASPIELTMDGGRPVTATSDRFGDATLAVPAPRSESTVLLFVDFCGTAVKVLVVSQGLRVDAAEPGCHRTAAGSVFIMRPVTTFVVDIIGDDAAVHVRQGPPPPEWVDRGERPEGGPGVQWGTPQTGLTVSAGVGLSTFGNAVDSSCGTAATCDGNRFGGSTDFGADFWLAKFVAAHVNYLRPADVVVSGKGDTFRFDSRQQTRLFTVGAKAGGPVGPARIYGLGGLNRMQTTSTTTETTNDTSVVVNGATQVVKGGTQSFAQQSQGWSWTIGGGFELWVRNWIAVYGEGTMAKLKGKPIGGGEGGIDDQAIFAIVGARVRLGR